MYNKIEIKSKGDFIMHFLNSLSSNNFLKVLLVFIVLDTIFGILRAIKQKRLNSNIGIDGVIRKVAMLISIIFFIIIDVITKFNIIGFLPNEAREFINIDSIGLAELFSILFIVYEFLSVIKNMIKCKLPIPKKLQKFLENILNKYTTELNEKENDK